MSTAEREMHVYTGYTPTPWQAEVLEDQHQFIVICAGRRTGKTILALTKLVKAATEIEGSTNLYVAPTYGMAKDIAWSALKDMVEPFRQAGIVQRVYESDLIIRFRSGSIIQLKGADKEDALRGMGLDFVVLDEIAVMKPRVWSEILRPSVVDHGGKAMFISTPQGYDAFYEMYLQETKEPLVWKSYHFQTIDNPYVNPAEIEQARRDMDDRAFKQEFCASFVTFGGQVFTDFDRSKHVVQDLPFLPGAEYGLGVDFGWSSPSVALFINVDAQENVTVFAEYAKTETPVSTMALAIKEQVPGHLPTLIGCDPAGAAKAEAIGLDAVSELRSYFGFDAVKYRKNYPGVIQDGVNGIRKWLRNGKLRISSRCPRLIEAFEMYRYPDPKDGVSSELPLKDGKSDHYIDALRYWFHLRFPLRTARVEAL